MKHLSLLLLLATLSTARAAIVANPFTTNIVPLTPAIDLNSGSGLSNRIIFTNNAAGQPTVTYVMGTNSRGFRPLSFGLTKDDGNYGAFWLNPLHDGVFPDPTNSEWQINFPHHIAILPGFGNRNQGHIQIGNPDVLGDGWRPGTGYTNWANMYFQPQADDFNGSRTWLDAWSLALCFKAAVRSNNLPIEHFVGMFGFGHTNKGMSELVVATGFGDLFDSDNIGHPGTVEYAARFQREAETGNRHVVLLGSQILERRFQTDGSAAFGSVTNVLDFGKSYSVDISSMSTNLSLVTSNAFSASTNYEAHVVFVRAQVPMTLNVNASWLSSLGMAACNITNGQLARLGLESIGAGETNVALVSLQVMTDKSYVWDGDALNWLTNSNVNVTNGLTQGLVNYFVLQLKAFGLWTNIDWINPCLADVGWGSVNISNASRVNLKNPSQTGTWHGTPTFSSSGVTGSSVTTAYMDTGFTPIAHTGVLTKDWCHLMVYGSTSSITHDQVSLGTDNLYVYQPNNGCWLASLNQGGTATFFCGEYRGPLIVTRTGASSIAGYLNSVGITGSAVSTAIATGNLTLLANGAGSVPSDNQIRGWQFGGGLTDTDAASLTTIWNNFNQALGRKVP